MRVWFLAFFVICGSAFAQVQDTTKGKSFKDRLGMGYFFFFDGPNLDRGQDLVTNRTGVTGNPINSYYIFSFKYKLTDKYNLDFQPGVQHWYTRVPRARFDRMRVGISGKLWQSGAWTLDGAANSDLPYFGYTANERTLIFSQDFLPVFHTSLLNPAGVFTRW